MTTKEHTQQAFLRAAKDSLGLQWDELAVAAGIVPRTLKNYRLPATSSNYRGMPNLARQAIDQLLEKHAKTTSKKRA